MFGRKDSEAQRRAKAEAAERAAWQRESILAEEAELAREAERWHPQAAKQPPKSQDDPPTDENTPSSDEKPQTRKDSQGRPVTELFTSAPGELSPTAEEPEEAAPASQRSIKAFEQILGVVQEVKQRIDNVSAETSAAAASRNRDEPSLLQQALMQEAFDRVARIVEGAQGAGASADAGPQPGPPPESLDTAETSTKRSLINSAVSQALKLLEKARQSAKKTPGDAEGAGPSEQSAAADPGRPEEPDAGAGALPQTSKEAKAKEEKAKAKAAAQAKKVKIKAENARKRAAQTIIEQENKFAKKEARAERHEQKWRVRREAGERKKLEYRAGRLEPGQVGGTAPPHAEPSVAVTVDDGLPADGGDGDGGDEPSRPQPVGGGDGASTPLSPPPRARGRTSAATSPFFPPAAKSPASVSFPGSRGNYKFASGMTSPVDAAAARNDWLVQRAAQDGPSVTRSQRWECG